MSRRGKHAPASSPLRKAGDIRVGKSLTGLGEDIVGAAAKGKNPAISIPLRALSNVRFNKKTAIIEMGKARQSRSFFNVSMAKRFMQTVLVASGCKQLVDQQKTASIRALYYRLKHTLGRTSENTFDAQAESDPLIEDLEVSLDALREELRLYADNRGAMVGGLTIVDRGDVIDCRRMGSGGYAVPSIVEPDVIQFRKCDAKFILLVEKGTVWGRFNEDRFWEKHKCLLVHGGGQPPRGVRRLLYRMVNELELPLYVLVDNDPWGYYIYSVVKQGSINLAFESRRMAIPTAKFLGMSSYDPEKYSLPTPIAIKLSEQDKNRANELLKYPWFQQKEWQREIRNMLSAGLKWEVESFSNHDFSFVTENYLPRKLHEKDWLG